MTYEERHVIASNIEKLFRKAAGVVRNRIMDGLTLDEATVHESVEYWTNLIEKEAGKLIES